MRCAAGPRAPRSALLLCATLLGLFATGMAQNATCFYPNGDIADSEHVPCDPNATGGTTCCSKDFECLSNGLCNDIRYENHQRVLRGACTDEKFGGFCNQVCTEYWPQGDESVWYCGNGEYCCSRTDTCCNDNKVRKQFQGEPTAVALAGKTTPQASDFKIYPVETGFYNPGTATTSRTATPSPTNESSSPSSDKDNNTLPIAVGVGVGVGVVVVALLVFAFWFIRRRRRRNTAHTMHELPATGASAQQPPPATAAATPATAATSPHNSPYAYDDKAGGWTSKPTSRWSRPVVQSREADGSMVYEAAAGVPVAEMQGHGAEFKGATELEHARESRFVEGGLWEQQHGQPQVQQHQQQQQQQQHQQGHMVYGGHDAGHGVDAGTVETEKDVEGLQRRLRGLSS